ncbi:MAG: asparaginase [Actinobacteria bacterium]|nr:asparaginase [Actinomycetota bacterium]
MSSPISVVVRRGDVVESRHRVHAVAARDGEIVDSAGDPELVTFLRSAAKPFQALPLAREHPELAPEELAIACASHEALPEQLAAVGALLALAGAGEDDLECGAQDGSRLRHNCSGKHAGMLLHARTRGWPRKGYRLPDHPLQEEILALVADTSGLRREQIRLGTDGCGVVAFGIPLVRMAEMFSRLVRGELDGATAIADVMRGHPDLIGGPSAPDSTLMRAVPGAVAKRGAEGVLCAGLPDGNGVAIKVEDGASRAAGPALGRFLGVEELAESPVFNSRGEQVGAVSPCS